MSRRVAFLSVSNKMGIVPLAQHLSRNDYRLLCSDGTYSHLAQAGVPGLQRLSDLTGKMCRVFFCFCFCFLFSYSAFQGWPEMLGGRVKSLHPRVFGGLLADRSNESHLRDVETHSLPDISVAAVNFYPFTDKAPSLEEAVALMDIGGVSVVRAAAKNFQHVTVLTDPSQYRLLMEQNEPLTLEQRKQLAQAAFQLTSSYDAQIASYLLGSNQQTAPETFVRRYHKVSNLKYGLNPHQTPAALYQTTDNAPNLKLLNGRWGYINILDAVNAWGLVSEISQETGKVSAASFKHTMPAGAALGCKWNELPAATQTVLSRTFGLGPDSSESVLAYARARNADPLCSFGDFIGFSGVVDADLARFIGNQIADGIVANGFTDEALDILSKKKKGSFVVIQGAAADVEDSSLSLRDIGGGLTLAQAPNTRTLGKQDLLKNIPTAVKTIPDSSVVDLILANATIRYAESNSIAAAAAGCVIGVAAGQQSRVDAVRLVAEKARVYMNRHSPAGIAAYESAAGSKQDRILTATAAAKAMSGAVGDGTSVVMASDGFFPFGDGIDEAAKIPGLRFLSQPGGSMRDEDVIAVADKHGLGMSLTGVRVFTH